MSRHADTNREDRKLVLIVEDHPEQAVHVSRILSLRGYSTIIAECGELGLTLARKHVPDAMLLDLMLPDINGFDVCRRLRTDPATMLIPVVILSALNDVQHRVHGYRVGATAYVTKPYGVDDLFDAISGARAWRSRMEQRALHGEIHIELNSEITFLKDLNDFLLLVCQATPLAHEHVMQLRQAIMEMAHNAIEWGNLHQSDRLVNLTYRVFDDRLEIVVRDQGPAFDRNPLPDAAVTDDPSSHLDVREKLGLRAGGFGLLIRDGMVDDLQYNDRENAITLIKRFKRVGGSTAAITGPDGGEREEHPFERSGGEATSQGDAPHTAKSHTALPSVDDSTACLITESTSGVQVGPTNTVIAGNRGSGDRLDRSGPGPSRIASAIAEIVGGYCHDLKNRLLDVALIRALPEPKVGFWDKVVRSPRASAADPIDREERLARAVRHADELVDNLHQFVRQFYHRAPRGAVGEAAGLGAAAAEERLRGISELLIEGKRPVRTELRFLGLETDYRIPEPLFDVVVVPLYVNALEAIAASGVGENVSVEVGREGVEQDLAIQVADDGPGWPAGAAELQGGILRRQSFSTKGPGRGGGLIGVDRVVHKLGGRLTLVDLSGGGARVCVVLPAEVSSG
jgi:DNA-binding response OmpR family regulator